MLNKLKQFFAFAKKKPIEAAFVLAFIGVAIAYGSTKPPVPPPVIEEKGITITNCDVDSEGVRVKWKSDDERIEAGQTLFIIEARERPMMLGKTVVFQPTNSRWYEIGRTTDFEIAHSGVWTDKSREIRVRTVLIATVEESE